MNDKAPVDKEDFSEDDVWQFETNNKKETYTKNGQEYTINQAEGALVRHRAGLLLP